MEKVRKRPDYLSAEFSFKERTNTPISVMHDIKKKHEEALKEMSRRERAAQKEKLQKVSLVEKNLREDINVENFTVRFRRFSKHNHPWLDNTALKKTFSKLPVLPRVESRSDFVLVGDTWKPGGPLVFPPIYKQHVFTPQNTSKVKRKRENDNSLNEICKTRYLRLPKLYDPY